MTEAKANRLDRPDREELYFLICGTVNGDLRSCTKGWCPKCSFRLPRLDDAIDKLLSLIDPKAIRREVAEEIRGKIEDFTANAGAQKYKDDLLIYLFVNPSNQD